MKAPLNHHGSPIFFKQLPAQTGRRLTGPFLGPGSWAGCEDVVENHRGHAQFIPLLLGRAMAGWIARLHGCYAENYSGAIYIYITLVYVLYELYVYSYNCIHAKYYICTYIYVEKWILLFRCPCDKNSGDRYGWFHHGGDLSVNQQFKPSPCGGYYHIIWCIWDIVQ